MEHEQDSVIDLAWYNAAAVQQGTFSGLKIDWEGCMGSDHALLQVKGTTCSTSPQRAPAANLGFVINPDLKDEWIKADKALATPLSIPSTPTTEEIDMAAVGLSKDIQNANEQVFHRQQPFHPKAAPWWTATCALAAHNLCKASSTHTCTIAQACLKGTVHAARHNWTNDSIVNLDLWEVAAWHHRCRVTKVPSLHGPEGLVHSHNGIANILSQQFFAKTPLQVAHHFYDDPLA